MDSYEIDIKEVNEIDGGVEVFASAKKDGVPVGFGKDGTVEIERFKIMNPPILVSDPIGTILRSNYDDVTGTEIVYRYTEDPEAALHQALGETIKIVGKDEKNIISGKIGNTTSTFYPSLDGDVRYENGAASFATVQAASSGSAADYTGGLMWSYSQPSGGGYDIRRVFTLFDTSTLGADSIDSATYSLFVEAIQDNDNDAEAYITVVQTTPASDSVLVVGDYDQCGSPVTNPSEGVATGDRFDISSAIVSTYHDFIMNSTGESWVDGSGITKLGVREGHDTTQTTPVALSGLRWSTSEDAGTTQDPKLVVEHSAGGTPTTNNSARRLHMTMM